MSTSASVQAFFDPSTSTVSYVIADLATRQAAVVDPVLDLDLSSGSTSTTQADQLIGYLNAHGLSLQWILETHVHADHLSGASYVQAKAGGRTAIGENIREVQTTFKHLYHLDETFQPDGKQFDLLFKDGETFRIGELEVTALKVPGHTPADMAYLVAGHVFVGDTLFMPDVGSARTDFPGGDARVLYRSIRRLLALPPDTRIHVCHDYPPAGRRPAWESTVAEQRERNIHVRDSVTEEAFVEMRCARDATLDVPALMLPALQVNIRAGRLPPAEDNGTSYLKVPLNRLGGPARQQD